MEAGIPAECRLWCPNERCSRMMHVDFATLLDPNATDEPTVVCPHCATLVCARCRIRRHAEFTCAEVRH
eukprot:3524347-Pyramimonas_sp.AAC.1